MTEAIFATLLSKLLARKESRGDMQGAALVKQVSPVAWQHVNLYGRYEFRKQPDQSLWMWMESFGNWLKSGSEPRPLWRRDPELNLFAGICKKPKFVECVGGRGGFC